MVPLYLVQSLLLERLVEVVQLHQVRTLGSLERWQVHLLHGRLKLVTVVSDRSAYMLFFNTDRHR